MTWRSLQRHLKYLSEKEQERVHTAYRDAVSARSVQHVITEESAAMHSAHVMEILANVEADADTLCAQFLLATHGWQHDEVELDTKKYSPAVIELYKNLSVFHNDEIEHTSLNEWIAMLQHLLSTTKDDVRVIAIHLADRLHTVRTLTERASLGKVRPYVQETADVFTKIAARLGIRDWRCELEEYCTTLLDPAGHKRIAKLASEHEQRGAHVRTRLEEYLETVDCPIVDCVYESSPWPILQEQWEDGRHGTGRTNVAIICDTIEDCYRTLGILHARWQRLELSFQDFINTPAINGYRSLHTTLLFKKGLRGQCRIRTREMHEYAQRGILTRCFDGQSVGLMEYLPKRTTMPSAIKSHQATDFWESLQNDVLEEVHMVHGKGKTTVTLPPNTTVLDAAYALYGEQTFYAKSFFMNAEPVSLETTIVPGSIVEIETGRQLLVKRDWLNTIRTPRAENAIRTALSQASDEHKIKEGRILLQNIFTQRGRGYLEEFEEEKMTRRLKTIGLHSLKTAYIAIAEGKREAQDIYNTLFDVQEENVHRQVYAVNFTFQPHKHHTEEDVQHALQPFQKHLISSQTWYGYARRSIQKMYYRLTQKESIVLEQKLKEQGTHDLFVESKKERRTLSWAIACLLLIWGMDPVFANLLLMREISAIDLTIVRSVIFGVSSALFYIASLILSPLPVRGLPLKEKSLLYSGMLLFGTALFTYQALELIGPTQYISWILIGICVLSQRETKQKIHKRMLLFGTCIFICFSLCMAWLQQFPPIGVVYAILSSACWNSYTVYSARYQQESGVPIVARYPSFLLLLSSICLLCTLPLLPYSQLHTVSDTTLLLGGIFVLCFIVTQYILYYILILKRKTHQMVGTYTIPTLTTMLAEVAIFRTWVPLVLCILLLSVWWQYVHYRRLN